MIRPVRLNESDDREYDKFKKDCQNNSTYKKCAAICKKYGYELAPLCYVEEGKTARALGKLEILEGELAILRKDYEELDGGEEPAPVPTISEDLSFMNKPMQIIDESETEVIN